MTLGNYRVRGGAQVQEGYKKGKKVGVQEASDNGNEVGREGLGHIFGGSCFSGRLLSCGMRDGAHIPKRLSPSFSPLATLYTEG